MAKVISLVLGQLTEVQPITTSAGAGDASKLAQTDSGGKFDISLMPNGLVAETTQATASEALAAGDFVNFWDNAGTLSVRKADATGGNAKKADGFVKAAVSSSATATVYYGNINDQLSGLTKGAIYFLSGTPGGVTTTAPSASNNIVQRLGKALSTTQLLVEIQDTIVLV